MIYHKDMKAYTEQKAKVFVVILGQCSSEVKNNSVSNVGFEALEDIATKCPKNADAAKKKMLAFMQWADSDSLWKYLENHGGLNVRSIDDMPLGWLLKCFQSWNLTEEHQSI